MQTNVTHAPARPDSTVSDQTAVALHTGDVGSCGGLLTDEHAHHLTGAATNESAAKFNEQV